MDLISAPDNTLTLAELNIGLQEACRGGQMQTINDLLDAGANDIERGMLRSIYGSHTEIVKSLITAGARNFDDGLMTAVEAGNIEMSIIMIEHEAKNWNACLRIGCYYGYMMVIHLLIKHSEDELDWNAGYRMARAGNRFDAIHLMTEWKIYVFLLHLFSYSLKPFEYHSL
jgi:hypothetical protein